MRDLDKQVFGVFFLLSWFLFLCLSVFECSRRLREPLRVVLDQEVSADYLFQIHPIISGCLLSNKTEGRTNSAVESGTKNHFSLKPMINSPLS